MIKDVLQARLQEYAPKDAIEQENILQEQMQHYVLAGLARADLFSQAVFHGGTCLRIVYRTSRFSEDLDFILKQPDSSFQWKIYIDKVRRDSESDGILFTAVDRSEAKNIVRKTFLKTDSIGKILTLDLPFARDERKLIRIKLEIDTQPPAGSEFETKYITFPTTVPLTVQTLESGFAMKLHALLCRTYAKGRDWYDFIWYVSRQTQPKLKLLANALDQQGPWAGIGVKVDSEWLLRNLRSRIDRLNINTVQDDVRRFLPISQQEGLNNWSRDLFLQLVERMTEYCKAPSKI